MPPNPLTARAVGQIAETNGHRVPEHEKRLSALETEVRVLRSVANRLAERLAELEKRLGRG